MKPLVSAIMLTGDRPHFVKLSIGWFSSQDYPHKELVVVDDGNNPLEIEPHPQIRIIRLQEKRSTGLKMNVGVAMARGEVIVKWDDDDWFGPDRLSRQVKPIIEGEADIAVLKTDYGLALSEMTYWRLNKPCPLVPDDGTTAFRRSLWGPDHLFLDMGLGEMIEFIMRSLVRKTPKLQRVENNGSFLYVKHPNSQWKVGLSEFMAPAERPDFLPREVEEAYEEISSLSFLIDPVATLSGLPPE